MPLVLATIIAIASVIASTLLAVKKPDWLRRGYRRWVTVLFGLSLLCFQQVYFWAAVTVGNLADRLTYAPDSSLRSVQPVIGWAVEARHTFFPPFVILMAAAVYLAAVKALRDLPPATSPRSHESPGNAA